MKKVIRLTESDLVDIVKNIISEQNYSEIKATTDPKRVVGLSVLTDAGLPADESNFRGRWVLEQPNIYKTFSQTKNLSLFRNLAPKSPADGENFIEMTVQRFLPNQLNPDRTIKVKGGADTTTPPVVESLTNTGSKTFNVKYPDPDGKHVWSLIRIVASGNGLLALSRALLEATGLPNKITIGMSQTTRESGGYTYNATKVANTTPVLNLISNMTAASIITKNGLLEPTIKKYVSGDMTGVGRYFNKSNEEIANLIAQSLYHFDDNFIPEGQKDVFRKKVDASGKPLLPNYNSAPFLAILNQMPLMTDINGLLDGDSPQQKWSLIERGVINSYSKFNELIKNAVIEQYKARLIAFFTSVYKDSAQATQLVNSTAFRPASMTIQESFENAVIGVKYSGASGAPKAGETKTSNTYEVGKSKPNTPTK
jgi:hypothetical protein